ncbi:MAG: FlgO family outer membrane protein [Thermodesulfobacteriota bacterium]
MRHGKILRQWSLGLALLLALPTGCAPTVHTGGTASVVTPDFFGLGEEVAQQLARDFPHGRATGMRLMLTTMVEVDDLSATSRFGRTMSESLATRLFRHGFGVVEIRKASEVLVKNNSGELMLTRDAKLLAKEQRVHGIVVGTYSLTPQSVIVNVRILDAASQDVLSVAGVEIQRSANINHLLAASAAGLQDAGLSARER